MKRLFLAASFALIAAAALSGTAGATTRGCAPRSFDYFDQAGVEHTGIDLNLHESCAGAHARRHPHPRSFDYFDAAGVEHTGIDLNLYGAHWHHHHEHAADD
jgi:hypothetical protein